MNVLLRKRQAFAETHSDSVTVCTAYEVCARWHTVIVIPSLQVDQVLVWREDYEVADSGEPAKFSASYYYTVSLLVLLDIKLTIPTIKRIKASGLSGPQSLY